MEAAVDKQPKARVKEQPLLFISHKHEDREIADAVARFALKRKKVRVFQSSDPRCEGPRQGRNLNEELGTALLEAGVVILIYTSAVKDWAWCMYECGVATDPSSLDTKVIVIQCLPEEEPSVYLENVRVLAWDEENVYRFVDSFLRDDIFFSDHGKAIAPNLTDDGVKHVAADLHRRLNEAIKERAEEKPECPFLQVELTNDHIGQIKQADLKTRWQKAKEVLLSDGKVAKAEVGLKGLFGLVKQPALFKELVEAWQEEYPDLEAEWLDALCRQIANGVANRGLREQRTLFREVQGDKKYFFGLSRVHSMPSDEKMQFDFYFYYNSTIQSVSSTMTRMRRTHRLNRARDEQKKLEQVLADLDGQYKRVPILDEADRPVCVLHVSMIDKFIRKRAYSEEDVKALTLADLLHDAEIKSVLKQTFVVVNEDATVEDAAREIEDATRKLGKSVRSTGVRPRSVFVTPTGLSDEEVLGWLADNDIAHINRRSLRRR